MERSFQRKKSRNWRGRTVFSSTHAIAPNDGQMQALKEAGLLGEYIYVPPHLLNVKAQDFAYHFRCWVALLSGSVIKVRHLLGAGVTIKSTSIFEANRVDTKIEEATQGLASIVAQITSYDGHRID